MTDLVDLNFSQNHMRGPIPSELGNLQQLTLLALFRNGYQGTIPTEVALLTNLEDFYLQNTWLEGSLEFLCDG